MHTKLKYNTFIYDLTFHEILYKKIQWKGYIKNSLINETNYKIKEIKLNEDRYDNEFEFLGEILEDFLAPFVIGKVEFIWRASLGISGSIIGGIICPNILLGIIAGGALSYILGFITGGKIEVAPRYYSNSQYFVSNTSTSKEKNNINKEQIKEELQKFVYFKEDKIIGFIKFKN